MTDPGWPYNLPIWRRRYEAPSPDRQLVARIDPALEVAMSAPTLGTLCVSSKLHIERCNPSFVWSDDSRFLAVPQYFLKFGWLRRQRLLIIAFHEGHVYASRASTRYFQPESFIERRLVVSLNPARSSRRIEFDMDSDLRTAFRTYRRARWAELPLN